MAPISVGNVPLKALNRISLAKLEHWRNTKYMTLVVNIIEKKVGTEPESLS